MINGEVFARLIISKKLKKRKNNNLEAVYPEAHSKPSWISTMKFLLRKVLS